jgi:hypothetical protein
MSNLNVSQPCDDCGDPDQCAVATECQYQKLITERDRSIEEYQKLAQQLWFESGSCTGGKSE